VYRGGVIDPSNGYEAIARSWEATRSATIGVAVVLEWARGLPVGSAILDLGCGDGFPLSVALSEAGYAVHGVDASPTMVAGFRRRLPEAPVECCAVEEGAFLERTFDGVMAWGLLFLLTPEMQRAVIARVGKALRPGGRFLFTAPWEEAVWLDVGTGRESVSLGREEYLRVLVAQGMALVGEALDEGENYYYLAERQSDTATIE
jgi:SAM-dependent methyltransferase